MGARATRKDDEELLKWLRLRHEGLTSAQVGERFGVADTHVRVATNRVMQADLAESKEPPEEVRRAYW